MVAYHGRPHAWSLGRLPSRQTALQLLHCAQRIRLGIRIRPLVLVIDNVHSGIACGMEVHCEGFRLVYNRAVSHAEKACAAVPL